jgi:WD40 repeat protein
MQFLLIFFTLVFLSFPVAAQDAEPPVITAENVTQLESVATIDFDDYLDALGEVPLGWFKMDEAGQAVVVPSRTEDGEALGIWSVAYDGSDQEFVLLPGEPGTILGVDVMQRASSAAVAVARFDGQVFSLTYQHDSSLSIQSLEIDGLPVNLWFDTTATDTVSIWVEVEAETASVMEFDLSAVVQTLPYTPGQDQEAVVRVGRSQPPYAVTSSIEGLVKLWNLQTGEVLAEVDNGTGEPSVFGAVNADATHLAWRDNLSNNLYLLDFATGENQLVAELDEAYMQFMFLAKDADLIIGVNLDFEPSVYAWDVATGERYDLGPYRICSRVPDMARLSADGTTLVIGCDTGLDFWRIMEED